VLVAAPVGPGEPGQFDRLDRAGILQVRSAAEIGEVALGVQRDVAFGRIDQLDLVVLITREEALPRLLSRDLFTLPLTSLSKFSPNLFFDARKIVLADRLRELEVVVEAVLDRRPDRDLHAGVEAANRLGEQVRRRVAEHGERVRIVLVARGQDLDVLSLLERQAQVLHPAVRAHQHRFLG
jgi:hypothetical protein